MSGQLQVYFDDYELTEFIRVTDLDRGIFSNGGSRTETRNNKRGVTFLGTKSAVSEMSMEFVLMNELVEKRRALAQILSVSEPKKLIFSDEPDKYYLAFPSSDIDVTEKRYLGTATIKWEIPDGVAYSTTETTFTNLDVNDAIQNYITINNPGTLPMKLDLEATFHSDSGFFALESEDGETKVMFGSTEEADGETYQASEKLVETTDFSDWEDWTSNSQDSKKQCTLKLSTTTDSNGIMLGAISGTMGTTGTATGGCKRIMIPADSSGKTGAKNFYVWARHWFETSKIGQTGTTGLNVVAADGSLIASYVIEKVDKNGNTARISMITGDAPTTTKKYINFTPAYWISANPYTSRQTHGGGPWDLKKEGSKITFYWYGSYFPFVVPSLENKEAAWIEYYVGQWNNSPLTEGVVGGVVAGKHLRYLSFTKYNVDRWADNPNSFGVGDVLTYGQDGRNFYATLNGLQALSLRDPGSTSIIVPPGESKIYVAYSSFGSVPTVKLTGRAVFA